MPIKKVSGGYKWGGHGKVYPNRTGAERQAAAAHANGFTGDAKATLKEIGQVVDQLMDCYIKDKKWPK